MALTADMTADELLAEAATCIYALLEVVPDAEDIWSLDSKIQEYDEALAGATAVREAIHKHQESQPDPAPGAFPYRQLDSLIESVTEANYGTVFQAAQALLDSVPATRTSVTLGYIRLNLHDLLDFILEGKGF